MRRATEGIDASVSRLVASTSSPDRIADWGWRSTRTGIEVASPLGPSADRTPESNVPTIEAVIATLEDLERRSIPSRVV